MTKEIMQFIKYFDNVWIIGKHGNNFCSSVWNQHECIGNRTNNQLEGFHSQLNKDLCGAKKSIYTIIRHFKTIDSEQTNNYLRFKNCIEIAKPSISKKIEKKKKD